MKMLDLLPDSDEGDIGSDALQSSQSSSMSSGCGERCSSFSRPSSPTAPSPAIRQQQTLPTSTSSPGCAVAFTSQKPHRSSDPAWAAILRRRGANGGHSLGTRDFKLLRRIGSGDIGTVFLCRLRDEDEERGQCPYPLQPPCLYAMKVVDKQELARKKKTGRAETERRVLRELDHPFLPTLYADFDAPLQYSCVVMEFCSGGDLHSLRHRQPGKRFSLAATRFYAAEVLLALEYLHMLGIVYRDLKPENVLIRSDGHIMLSDFDLSLESTASPTVDSLSLLEDSTATPPTPPSTSDHLPSCLPDLFRPRKNKPDHLTRSLSSHPDLRFVAEPIHARSNSFVGTHEYVSPEVASGNPHGSAVDWWAYGIFLYELIHGRTPFAGPSNESTLRNIVKQPLSFPSGGPADPRTRDLISSLLDKDPSRRLGSRLGAADVKAHPFFAGLNFALLRSHQPPVIPGLPRSSTGRELRKPDRFDFF